MNRIMNKNSWIKIACCLLLWCGASTQAAEIQSPPIGVHNRWPIYDFTQYLYLEKYDLHVLGTPDVSEWMMRESQNLVGHATPSNNWHIGTISVAKRERNGRPEILKCPLLARLC